MEWQDPPAELSDHVVICNCSPKLRRIVAELHAETVARRPDVLLVVQDRGLWERNPEWHPEVTNPFTEEHFFVLYAEGGPASELNLRRAGIARARTAVILADPNQEHLADARSTLVALAIERQNPEIHTVMELISSVNRIHLRATEVNEVVCVGEMAEKLIAQSCITPGVKNVFHDLLTTAAGTNRIFTVPLPKPLEGMSYKELVRRSLETAAPFVLCGYVQHNFMPVMPARGKSGIAEGPICPAPEDGQVRDVRPVQTFVLNPPANRNPGRDTALTENDQLLLIAYERPKLERFLLPPGA